MRKTALVTGLFAATAIALAPENTSEAEAAYVMNFGTMAPADTPWSAQLSKIEKRIESESGGRIAVKLFLGGSLGGGQLEMLDDVKKGERLQGGGFSTGAMGEALDVAELTLIELPYLFRNTDEADAVLDEVLYQPVSDKLASKGIRFYAWAENGWRHMGTRGGPATTPEQISKFKMRSQENPVHLDMWKALGAQAVPKPTTEVLPALNTKIVDGFDNSPLFAMAGGWISPITHYTLTGHIYQPAAVVYSEKFYTGLPDDLQKIVLKDAKGEAAQGRASVRALESELIATIGGMTGADGEPVRVVTPSDEQIKTLRKTTRPVHEQFLASNPEMVPVYGEIKGKLRAMRK